MSGAPLRRRRLASPDRYISSPPNHIAFQTTRRSLNRELDGEERVLVYALPENCLHNHVKHRSSCRHCYPDPRPALYSANTSRPPSQSPAPLVHRYSEVYTLPEGVPPIEDFYISTLAWSPQGRLVLGTDTVLYLLSGTGGVVKTANLDESSAAQITNVCFSPLGLIAASLNDGRIFFRESTELQKLTTYRHSALASCMIWNPTDHHQLFVGETTGSVSILLIVAVNGNPFLLSVTELTRITAHNSQICAVDPTGQYLAVGENDNQVSVWALSSHFRPRFKFTVSHRAAIKALAFCPWAPWILATGGGTNDQKIEFHHVLRQKRLATIDTGSQVTALIWSRHSRQIAATLGFGRFRSLAVYDFPSGIRLAEVQKDCYHFRLLWAVPSPDNKRVAAVATDGSVRIYELWAHPGPELPVLHMWEGDNLTITGADLLGLDIR